MSNAGGLANHTIVIPTYNRPGFLSRLVAYYRERAPELNLLVLDSSRPQLAATNDDRLSTLGPAVRYRQFPHTEPMVRKIAQGMTLVTTATASLCADDDIVFPAGLNRALAFLAEHPDYVSAHGLYMNFRVSGLHVHVTREYSGAGNEAADGCRRIFSLCQNYESLFYAAFRTPDLQQITAAATALPTLHFQELFQSVAALVKGKVKRFASFYAGRQSCDPAEPGRDKWQTYYWFADNPGEMLAHYSAYCQEIWRFYQLHGPQPGLDEDGLRRVLDLAHAVYFSAGCPPKYFLSRMHHYWPGEPDEPPAARDLLQDLRPPSAQRRVRRTIQSLNSLRRRLRRQARLRWASALDDLDLEARRSSRTSWACRLPAELEWLAAAPDFRGAYAELCRYLDHS